MWFCRSSSYFRPLGSNYFLPPYSRSPFSLFSSQVPNQGQSERREKKHAFRLWWWSVIKDTKLKNLNLEKKIVGKLILKNLNGRGWNVWFWFKAGRSKHNNQLQIPQNLGNFLISREIISFWRMTLPHAVVLELTHFLLCRKSPSPHHSYVSFNLHALLSKAAEPAGVCRSARWPSWHYVSVFYPEYCDFNPSLKLTKRICVQHPE